MIGVYSVRDTIADSWSLPQCANNDAHMARNMMYSFAEAKKNDTLFDENHFEIWKIAEFDQDSGILKIQEIKYKIQPFHAKNGVENE